jgi:hypothetical protein
MFSPSIMQPNQEVNWLDPVNREFGPNQGLVARYLTLAQGGTRWRDVVSSNHGAFVNGPMWSGMSRRGSFGCVSFDNTDDYIDLTSTPVLLSGSSPMTLSWWEKITSDAFGFPSRFFFKCSGASTRGFLVFRSTNGAYGPLSFLPGDAGTYLRNTSAPTVAASVGIWRHWVITCTTNAKSTTPGDWMIYVDGQSYSPIAGSPAGFTSANTNRIGLDGLGDNPANCLMDDICLWNRALSAGEAKASYEDAVAGYPRGLNWLHDSTTWGYVAGGGGPATSNLCLLGVG